MLKNMVSLGRPPDGVGSASANQRHIADPRTLTLMFIVVNVLLTSNGSSEFALAINALISIGLVLLTSPKIWLSWAVFILFWLSCLYLLPLVWESSVSAFLVFIAFWMFRFSGIFGIAVVAFQAADISRIGAALTQMRAPTFVYVPIMVVVRFFPMALQEFTAIVEAMKLRNLIPRTSTLLFHPLRTAEYLIIPFLASAARIADNLSAAVIMKGLGAQKQRSTTWPTHFGLGDALIIFILIVLLSWRIWEAV
ncbi:energy-coupling factor transporter transmembrane component T [Corynebacterium kutscheri]|uniref:energy-coupling factor transporter transmembrane component T n=1 Tax=Corynebacterium kutscheri TaxID=35755 RepID=UPI001E417579|nr:energy-coupling factor transporter transmembrane component T [Corynebacterium kutscheri]